MIYETFPAKYALGMSGVYPVIDFLYLIPIQLVYEFALDPPFDP